ncbi:MAG: RluA family pseudouridine synthase [Planctomycetota bacterium]|nr:RluA family pseudouridine synthase [Planctomycetota bacterium]
MALEHSQNSGWIYLDRIAPRDHGTNVLEYHARRFTHSTIDEWRVAIEAGRVLVNGRTAQASETLMRGDELAFHRPPWCEPEAPTHFGVVFEDDDVLVAEKPAGLQVLPAGPFCERTLLTLVQRSAVTRTECAPVHRLGRGTSGLVLFGKTRAARADLSRQFRECTPCKTYFALVDGTTLVSSARARQPIGRIAHGPMTIHVAMTTGKAALTRVRVLSRDSANDRSLVAAQPITGRPDQIRIHLAALGAPIVGDPLFGVGGVAKSDATPGAGGYFLHAAGLRFVHPKSARTMKFRSRPMWLPAR